MSETVVMPELDYQKRAVSHGYYTHTKQYPNISGNITLSASGGNETLLDVPVKALNFGKSYLNCYVSVPTQATYSFTNISCMSLIRQISLYTRDNVILADIVNFSKYHKTVNRYETKYDDFITRDGLTIQTTATTANADEGGVWQGLAPSNKLVNNNEAKRPSSADAFKNYTESQYMAISANNTARGLVVRFPLSEVVNSILGMDKDLYFGEILTLKIVWNSTNLIAWKGSDPADSTATGAVLSNDAIVISDFHLLLAVEQNPIIVQSLKDKVDSGNFNIAIPYVLSNKINQPSSDTRSTIVKYSRGHGEKLQKIYFAIYHNDETTYTMYDHSNKDQGKITSLIVNLNNQRLNQFNINATSLDDYLQMKPYIKGSACQSSNEYIYNWMYMVNFINNSNPSDALPAPADNLVDGLPLDEEQMITFDCTTPSGVAQNHYVFAITQKTLNISSAGCILK